MIRPQRKRMKEQAALQSSIDVGDEVVTNSGIYGFITGVDGDKFWLEIDDDVQIRIARAAIQGKVNTDAAAEPSADDATTSDAATRPRSARAAGQGRHHRRRHGRVVKPSRLWATLLDLRRSRSAALLGFQLATDRSPVLGLDLKGGLSVIYATAEPAERGRPPRRPRPDARPARGRSASPSPTSASRVRTSSSTCPASPTRRRRSRRSRCRASSSCARCCSARRRCRPTSTVPGETVRVVGARRDVPDASVGSTVPDVGRRRRRHRLRGVGGRPRRRLPLPADRPVAHGRAGHHGRRRHRRRRRTVPADHACRPPTARRPSRHRAHHRAAARRADRCRPPLPPADTTGQTVLPNADGTELCVARARRRHRRGVRAQERQRRHRPADRRLDRHASTSAATAQAAWNALAAECYSGAPTCPSSGRQRAARDRARRRHPVGADRAAAVVHRRRSRSPAASPSARPATSPGCSTVAPSPSSVEQQRVETVSPTAGEDSLRRRDLRRPRRRRADDAAT